MAGKYNVGEQVIYNQKVYTIIKVYLADWSSTELYAYNITSEENNSEFYIPDTNLSVLENLLTKV